MEADAADCLQVFCIVQEVWERGEKQMGPKFSPARSETLMTSTRITGVLAVVL